MGMVAFPVVGRDNSNNILLGITSAASFIPEWQSHICYYYLNDCTFLSNSPSSPHPPTINRKKKPTESSDYRQV